MQGVGSREIHVAPCNVLAVGLREFVPRIMQELSLTMGTNVEFNMNSNAILSKWEDVFLAEKCYTTVLGISKRVYHCFGYTHEPARRLCYLILEEENHRSIGWLPTFEFKAMVICYYNAAREVTAVQVEYDQLGFYLNCLGLYALHAFIARKFTTPLAVVWARMYTATGVVHPFTFLLQVVALTALFLRLFVTSNMAACCFACAQS